MATDEQRVAVFDPLPWQQAVWARIWRARCEGRMPHALLVTGLPGMGKLQFARNLAHALLCREPDQSGVPCGTCRGCRLFLAGSHPDFRVVGPDSDSRSGEIKVDFIRELIDDQGLSAHAGEYKVVVVIPAERMNRFAANSLLKTLEEPASSTLLVLLTHRPARLLPTIRSRCQQLHLAPPPESEGLAWLRRRGMPGDPLPPLRLSGGAPLAAMRLAESGSLDWRREALRTFLDVGEGRAGVVQTAESWLKLDLPLLFNWMSGWVADLLRMGSGHAAPHLSNPDLGQELEPLARRLEQVKVHAFWREVVASGERLQANLNPQLVVESLLTRWSEITRQPGSTRR